MDQMNREEYVTALRSELAKFATGAAPYEYQNDPLVTGLKRWPEQDTCIAKIGEPFHMTECRRPVIYLSADEAVKTSRGTYTGWYHQHVSTTEAGHHGVPARMVR